MVKLTRREHIVARKSFKKWKSVYLKCIFIRIHMRRQLQEQPRTTITSHFFVIDASSLKRCFRGKKYSSYSVFFIWYSGKYNINPSIRVSNLQTLINKTYNRCADMFKSFIWHTRGQNNYNQTKPVSNYNELAREEREVKVF